MRMQKKQCNQQDGRSIRVSVRGWVNIMLTVLQPSAPLLSVDLANLENASSTTRGMAEIPATNAESKYEASEQTKEKEGDARARLEMEMKRTRRHGWMDEWMETQTYSTVERKEGRNGGRRSVDFLRRESAPRTAAN